MRLGLLGGSFDPVHYAHLLLGERAREQLGLDAVWFMPAAAAPHKRGQRQTPVEKRLAMLDLAVVGNPDFTVCRLEADAERVSFTIETLRRLSENRPGDELVFLVGADMLRDLPNWREPDEICRLAVIAAVRRPGTGEPDYDALAGVVDAERLARFRRHQVDMPAMDVSSTDIRRRVAQGESIRYMTPPAVERMIIAERLYRDGE